MAIATAGLLGYRLRPNFNCPYLAPNLADFWRRWHMSLSSWLRDYLYIPLGGSRHGRLRTYCNLLLTMVLGGIWHGAALKIVIWGALHGGMLALERMFSGRVGTVGDIGDRPLWRRVIAVLLTFHFVCLCWIFFRADNATRA